MYILRTRKKMEKKKEQELLRALDGMDVSEVMGLLIKNGSGYNRRILKFFRFFCKWVPIIIMCAHAYGIFDFSQHPREMFILIDGNESCYAFIYIMVYVLPMVIILASRFFWLCWRYRIPFFYYFGVNAIHIIYGSFFTTNDMVMGHFCLMLMVAMFYVYGFSELFINKTKLGRRLFV